MSALGSVGRWIMVRCVREELTHLPKALAQLPFKLLQAVTVGLRTLDLHNEVSADRPHLHSPLNGRALR